MAEEERKLKEAERALKKIKELQAQVPGIVDAQVAAFKTVSKVHLAASQAELDRVREDRVHQPKPMGNAIDLKLVEELTLSKGLSTQVAYAQAGINQWDDGFGKIIYLSPSVRMDQVQAVSARITEQQKSFGTLETDEQSRVRTATNSPYQDFLHSEALGKRFQALKQPHTSPK